MALSLQRFWYDVRNCNISLLMLHIRLVRVFITRVITREIDINNWHGYCSLKFLALAANPNGSGKGTKTIKGMQEITML